MEGHRELDGGPVQNKWRWSLWTQSYLERVSVEIITFPGSGADPKYRDKHSCSTGENTKTEEKAMWRWKQRLKICSFKPRNLKGVVGLPTFVTNSEMQPVDPYCIWRKVSLVEDFALYLLRSDIDSGYLLLEFKYSALNLWDWHRFCVVSVNNEFEL